jgi:hypothetical protein
MQLRFVEALVERLDEHLGVVEQRLCAAIIASPGRPPAATFAALRESGATAALGPSCKRFEQCPDRTLLASPLRIGSVRRYPGGRDGHPVWGQKVRRREATAMPRRSPSALRNEPSARFKRTRSVEGRSPRLDAQAA